MTDRDRPTPKDPLPAAKPPRPAKADPQQAQREDAQRLIREAGSAARKAAGDRAPHPPPLPLDPTPIRDKPELDRSRTPESGGIEAQPRTIHVEMADDAPKSKAPTSSDWAKLRFKLASALVGGLVLVIGAVAFYVVTFLQARTEAQKATKKAETATASTDKTAERITAVEAYLAAAAERRACLDRQTRDAITRGTGHVIISLPKGDVDWVEQNAPKAVPRTLWAKPTWFTVETCKAEPAVPRPMMP